MKGTVCYGLERLVKGNAALPAQVTSSPPPTVSKPALWSLSYVFSSPEKTFPPSFFTHYLC